MEVQVLMQYEKCWEVEPCRVQVVLQYYSWVFLLLLLQLVLSQQQKEQIYHLSLSSLTFDLFEFVLIERYP